MVKVSTFLNKAAELHNIDIQYPVPESTLDRNPVETNDFGVPRTRKIAKWMLLERPQHPQTPKLCGKRSISITFITMKKHIFFTKIIFSQYFWNFSTPQSNDFRDLPIR